MKLTGKVTPRYSRDFAFAVCKRDGEETSILLDVVGNYGTVRTQPVVAPKKETPAPFAVGKSTTGFTRQGSSALPKADSAPEKIEVPDGLHEKFLAAIPVILEKTRDRKSTRLNSSHTDISRMPSSA